MTKNNGCCVRKDLRMAIYLRDDFTCLYCGIDLYKLDLKSQATLDHLRPQSKACDNRPTNLITACRFCNCSRGAKPWKEYATGGSIKRILNHRRRSIKRYRIKAKEILAIGIKDFRSL